jgi:uncharacterized protein (DUF924 family)
MPDFRPEEVLDLWFPDDGHWETEERHAEFWATRMRGGMDRVICDRFGPLTTAAARCELDHWAETPRGRLALVIALDQFPRSLWRDTPAAYAQDIKATRLVLEALENGHYRALSHAWERNFYIVNLTHCEGPDHLARMALAAALADELAAIALPHLGGFIERSRSQCARVTGIIARFGRHPHRNPILGRVSSAAEEAYIAEGDFPHVSRIAPTASPAHSGG